MSYDFLKHATHSTKGKPQDKNLYWDDLNVVCSCSLQGIMNIVACSNSRISYIFGHIWLAIFCSEKIVIHMLMTIPNVLKTV